MRRPKTCCNLCRNTEAIKYGCVRCSRRFGSRYCIKRREKWCDACPNFAAKKQKAGKK